MLHHLRVQNLGLIQDAVVNPSPGFTVITGETGAGKTLLLGGLRLVLGGRADPSTVGPWSDVARVEGLLEAGGTEIAIVREIPREGRSRARLDGDLITVGTLAEKVRGLVEMVGQHSHLMLRSRSHLLDLVDSSLDDKGQQAWDAYGSAWSELRTILERQAALGGDEAAVHRELDLLRHQVGEIMGADIKPGEDEELEAEAERLRNVEAIAELLADSLRLIESISEDSGELVARLRKVADLDPGAQEIPGRAEELASLVTDLAAELRSQGEGLEADPRRVGEVEERLNLIGDLKRKYGRTVHEVRVFGEEAQARLIELEELLEAAAGINLAVAEARRRVDAVAQELTEARRAAARRIVDVAVAHLTDLGMKGATLEFVFEDVEPGLRGANQIQLLFSSDARLSPGPVASVASGGELSRLALALGLATRSWAIPTVAFDEVDAGIGGATALTMGRKLASLAGQTQVLCVTHLPQIAAHADRHYVVARSGEAVVVNQVDGEERLTEISRMLAGLPESQTGQEAAAELIAAARLPQ